MVITDEELIIILKNLQNCPRDCWWLEIQWKLWNFIWNWRSTNCMKRKIMTLGYERQDTISLYAQFLYNISGFTLQFGFKWCKTEINFFWFPNISIYRGRGNKRAYYSPVDELRFKLEANWSINVIWMLKSACLSG